MNFKSLATQVLMDPIEGANNSNHAAAALDRLAGENRTFDLGILVDRFQNSGGKLALVLPELIDKSSQGGELLNKIGSRRGFTGFA